MADILDSVLYRKRENFTDPPFTVLLVEDDLADAMIFEELLAETAPESVFHHVSDGADALKFMRQEAPYEAGCIPSLVVLDLNMPVMDGHELLRQLKACERLRRVPALVLSTSDRALDVERSYDVHAAGYIVKPGTYASYLRVMGAVKSYWTSAVRLPNH